MGKYKVFISFKNTDNGAETKDAAMAHELYNALTENNIPTFFSKVSILESGEGDYRNLIDAALDDCSILIAVGTKKEYLESKWVKYEYASFHDDILSGIKDVNKCTVCSYIADMQQRELPRPLRNLQSFDDMDKLVDFVRNHVGKPEVSQQNETEDSTTNIAAEEVVVNEAPVYVIPEKPATAKKSRKKIIPCIIAAVIAFIIALFIINNLAKKVEIPVVIDGEVVELRHSTDDNFVNIKFAELNIDSMTALSELYCIGNIILKDCKFVDDCYMMLADMSSLNSLSFENVQGISDFSFLNSLDLTEISLVNCGLTNENHSFDASVNDVCNTLNFSNNAEFSDLSFAGKFTALQSLTIDSTGVVSLSYLKNHPSLEYLSFNNCGISDLSDLAGIDLRGIYGDNNRISDISAIAGFETLENISFKNNQISSVTDEFKSLRLRYINLNENPIVSLIGFKNLTVLEELYFGCSEPLAADKFLPSEESGFDVLISRNAKTLRNLDVSYTSVTRNDLDALVNSEELQTVDISGIRTLDLSFLVNSLQLMSVRAENCGLINIDALSSAYLLREACFAGNSINDILSLPMDENLQVHLDLSDNGIVIDVDSFLHSTKLKFSSLLLYGNKINDLSFLQNQSVSVLGITYDENHDPSQINCNLYIENMPEYKIVAYEDAVSGDVTEGRYVPSEDEDFLNEYFLNTY